MRNAVDNRQLEGGKPTFFKPMRACIAMVYGNATALCAAFGLPNSVNYAKKLDVVTTRVLNLYNHETVEAIAEGAGCAQAPWMQMLLKRMQVTFYYLVYHSVIRWCNSEFAGQVILACECE